MTKSKILVVGMLVGGIISLYATSSYDKATSPAVYAQADTELETEPAGPRSAEILVYYNQLSDIADCESGVRKEDGTAVPNSARHYNEDQSVVIGLHTHPSNGMDIGEHQINSEYHGKRAKEMGLNLWDEFDNKEYAIRLYEERGTDPWTASADCWDN